MAEVVAFGGGGNERREIQERPSRRLELWGGYECTVNRVRDAWFDQTPRSGHEHRISDLQLFADLGMTALRYPALWERISPQDPGTFDFRWTDERLPRVRELGMEPILTLCHHGSGPHYTSLIQDSFAPGLARHARAVAERYPWVRDWTPVNEPLTTARFSALYGYWYPHTQTEDAFWTALLNEIDATRLSMREIRKINPQARLIQTDDLGFCHATEPLAQEAEYQNQRRWIGWDLLCGMVTPDHPLWERIASHGLGDRLRVIADDPCPPDVIGVNHYLASERLLDHRLELHLNRAVADRELGQCNGVPYVDVDAIRNREEGVLGLPALLRQAAERYGRTVAVTECHNGATREEQVRWFVEVWDGAQALRDQGFDICAVTAWSLLGSHDWNRMVTRFVGHYEVGVYDVRTGEPRPTMLAPVLEDLANGRRPSAIALEQPGWWRRTSRLVNAQPSGRPEFDMGRNPHLQGASPLLIVGAGSVLTQLIQRACEVRGLPYRRLHRAPDAAALARLTPWAVVDGRDWAGICQQEGASSRRQTRWPGPSFAPPEALVEACGLQGVPCAVFSAPEGFEEVDERLLTLGAGALLIARADGVFAPWDRSRFAVKALDLLELGRTVEACADSHWDETYGPDLVDAVLDLLMDGVVGFQTFAPSEPWSVAEFVRRLAETAECDPDLVVGRRMPTLRPAPAQDHESAAFQLLPPGETTLERFVRESRLARREGAQAVSRREDEPHLEPAAPLAG
ncbi:family 1 glycosylhydrolase [Phenylobacterium deserti]|uniref:dTDP-4-dehydrorhamnose reductase n=1 Tax=Phenylobacterium deserti TaxID=1914756 RepID=A0A328AUX6_9CAUL|nr:family 1 glycosylhydrolase [Phenylobacterium deserti]RAK56728.1 dTDP-4-dehydrorhamnose reductase [Phenylobacterium deserti]